MTATIDSIKVEQIIDTSPDTSFIGEYTDRWDEWAICRCCGEYLANVADDHEEFTRGREYRYFLPYAGGEEQGTPHYQKYGLQDYERMEGLNSGDWQFVGIVAKATIKYRTRNGSYRLETFTSGGLWGIESDAGDYLDEVKAEQLADLKAHLETFGVDVSDFDEMAEELELVYA